MKRSPARRSFVLATVGAVGALAGCLNADGGGGSGDESGDDGGDGRDGSTAEAGDGSDDAGSTTASDDGGSDAGSTTASGGDGTDATGTGGDLDLREANVTGVELERLGDGEVRFSVTLYHDDAGEDGYANWWTVETRDGEELGRRELLHAHGTREFTRSETVSVPTDVECVVVRGHDETHGYGGRAALVSVSSGATRFVAQGAERSSFADATCP